MPYSIPWDETEPVGAVTPAADIDEELQELKVSIRERMNDIVGAGNWEDDLVDPKVVTLTHFVVSSTGISTSAAPNGDFTLVEELSNAGVTIAGDTITFDEDGTYLLFFGFNFVVDDAAGTAFALVSLSGSSAPLAPQLQVRAANTSPLDYRVSVTQMGYVVATATQELKISYAVTNALGKTVTLGSIRLVAVKVG